MKEDKYNPEIGDIWWFEPVRRHCLILAKEEYPSSFYRYIYYFFQLETGKYDSILHGTMNAHGEGWFKKIV